MNKQIEDNRQEELRLRIGNIAEIDRARDELSFIDVDRRRGQDFVGGTIKSGNKTRRAALLTPEILAFAQEVRNKYCPIICTLDKNGNLVYDCINPSARFFYFQNDTIGGQR